MAVISHAAKQSFRGDPFPFVKRGVEFEQAVQLWRRPLFRRHMVQTYIIKSHWSPPELFSGIIHTYSSHAASPYSSSYPRVGRYSEAESLQVEVLECRQAELGDTHSDTLVAMNNLALTYYNQCRYTEAETLQVEVLETRAWLEGEASLEVATSAHNLAFTYRAMGRLVEAKELNEKAERIRNLYSVCTP